MKVVRLSKEEIETAGELDMSPLDYARARETVHSLTTIAEIFMLHRKGKQINDRDWNAAEAVMTGLLESGWITNAP